MKKQPMKFYYQVMTVNKLAVYCNGVPHCIMVRDTAKGPWRSQPAFEQLPPLSEAGHFVYKRPVTTTLTPCDLFCGIIAAVLLAFLPFVVML